MIRLQLLGGGRMGEALLSGLLAAGWAAPDEVAVVEKVPARRDELAERFAGVHVLDAAVGCSGAVVAVKPDDVAAACRTLAEVGVERVLSIAAGITIGALEDAVGDGVAVVRAMPNTPALVGAGAAAIAGGNAAGDDDLDWAESILGSVGTVVRVPERQLDAVTGLSGSGPAYVFLIAEALTEAGVLNGLSRDVAEALTAQTLLGAATLLSESDDGAPALRAAVTSPGGTTAAGLAVLEDRAVRAALVAAVTAATTRATELGS
jgi:pyrroline-5-carboxylate reductase